MDPEICLMSTLDMDHNICLMSNSELDMDTETSLMLNLGVFAESRFCSVCLKSAL